MDHPSKLQRGWKQMPPTWVWLVATPVLVMILMVAFFYHA